MLSEKRRTEDSALIILIKNKMWLIVSCKSTITRELSSRIVKIVRTSFKETITCQ